MKKNPLLLFLFLLLCQSYFSGLSYNGIKCKDLHRQYLSLKQKKIKLWVGGCWLAHYIVRLCPNWLLHTGYFDSFLWYFFTTAGQLKKSFFGSVRSSRNANFFSSVRSSVCLMKSFLELTIFISSLIRSVSGQSQISLRSVSVQSQVSLKSVSGQSQFSLCLLRQTERA